MATEKRKTLTNIISEALSGIIMIVCVLIYLILGFTINFWHPGWIIIVGGGLSVGILNIILNAVHDAKNLKKDEKEKTE